MPRDRPSWPGSALRGTLLLMRHPMFLLFVGFLLFFVCFIIVCFLLYLFGCVCWFCLWLFALPARPEGHQQPARPKGH